MIREPSAHSSPLAGDVRGRNFYTLDPWLRQLLPLYLSPELCDHLEPHLDSLGALAGGRLDALADAADKNEPVLRTRDRFGRDEEWIDYHPSYHAMEGIAFGELGLHAMSHRGGVLGWPDPYPSVAKYSFQYIFTQAEFGLMCPISVSDTSAHLVKQFAGDELRERLLPRMLSLDPHELWKGSQFMTEKAGGSDVGAIETIAHHVEGETWRLYGEKWFCSHADAQVALLLARPEGAPGSTAGLGLFAMPRTLDDGNRNRYRIVRLKPKLGTRSMASGEILLEGAEAWQIGDVHRGFKQMMEQVNLSRLSHGFRAAAMMRRCLNEALTVARGRSAFGKTLIDMPLVRRQLGKLLVPTEQALSMSLFAAAMVDEAAAGSSAAATTLRMLTPLIKYRTCRDNIRVATGAMEMRGGNGYVEDWVNARLVRDAHIGVIWEGTSNINALDAITRAIGRESAHESLVAALEERLASAVALPEPFRERLADQLHRAVELACEIARQPELETQARRGAAALYHASSAVLLAWESARMGDARRALVADLISRHRLGTQSPLAVADESGDAAALDLLLSEQGAGTQQVVSALG
ncbi:MAG: acyl-CoA dehydrogenase family protein [Acidobacteriota bacterium]|nr:acyl-CoA dehydrogenase family protein [Acidobacteriota bacterium]